MIYVGDVGATLTVATGYNITGYTTVKIYLINPSGTITSVTPDTITSSTGVLVYTTKLQTELSVGGEWTVQGVVWFGVNKPMFTDIDSFYVNVPPANPTGAII
jgi:hypothetical protein